MRVDIGNALEEEATPGVSGEALERLDARVGRAHDRITRGMADDEFGYAALTLPDRAAPEAIRTAVEPVADAEVVLTVGIGGSALGAVTVTAALGDDEHYALDNVDPAHTNALLDSLPLAETAVSVVSRSGTTPETLANFLVVRGAMADAGVDWTERTVVTTGEDGPLRAIALREDLPVLSVPPNVPGRFSVLSPVGLVPAAILGYDVEAVLEGGRSGRAALAGSLFECPAYAYGAIAHALEARGATVNAVMPYAEALEPFAEWFAQLWAESLGKDGLGQTPARALGATDQHSQLQLYRAGRHDRLVTLIRPRSRAGDDRIVPALETATDTDTDADADGDGDGESALGELAYLGGAGLGELLDAEFEATEASLAAADQPNVRVEIDRVDAGGIGELLYGMEAACILAGELADVPTFTQPAVEWGKRAARGLLADEDRPETDAVKHKTTRLIRSGDRGP